MQRTIQKALLPMFVIAWFCAGSAQAEVYKWVGSDGKVHYGDGPAAPPSAEKKAITNNVVESGDFPFALAETTKNAPVTLYTTQKCNACDEGRKLLTQRGIPFSEKTVITDADIASLGGNEAQLPQLTIGATKLIGLDSSAWQARLSAVGYPKSNQLPKNYRNPTATSASPDNGSNATASRNRAGAAGNTTSANSRATANQAAPRAAPARQPETTVPGLRF